MAAPCNGARARVYVFGITCFAFLGFSFKFLFISSYLHIAITIYVQSNINTIKAPSQNDASLVIRSTSRPPMSPQSLAVRYRYQPPAGVHRSMLSPEESLEIATYLQRQPSTPTRRRAVSVPPGLTLSRPSVPRWFPSSSSYYAHRSVAAPLPTGLPPRPPTTTHGLPSDAVVGIAHTSLYGDIVIGIPYKKRFMFNAQVRTAASYTSSLPIQLVPNRETHTPMTMWRG